MDKKTLTIRFVGDSGDGIQLVGQQFTLSLAQSGLNTQTSPDFPAEIRAPAGTMEGVSGFQVMMSESEIYTAGEDVDVLVAFNPAALSTSIKQLTANTLVIINQDSFTAKDYKKARVDESLLDNVKAQVGQMIEAPITSLTIEALNESDLSHSEKKKAKNFFVLGIVAWLFDFPLDEIKELINAKFKSKPEVCNANKTSLQTGFNYAITLELSRAQFEFTKTKPGKETRQVNGVEAIALAAAALTLNTGVEMLVSGYPITPASNILHELAKLGDYGITLFQAEDEIAAITASLGAAFAGKLALTCTSGPGLDLKAEGLSLAVMAELPMVVIDVMRAGPSTGLPTKTEQSDLNMALYGRHGESPLPVIAAKSPSDCFDCLIEAFKHAINAMTPVILLLDAQIANGQEPWLVPDVENLEIQIPKFNQAQDPYQRDDSLSRPWIVPGTPKLMHRIGGLEKQGVEGKVSYDGDNHQAMVNLRQQKIERLNSQYTLPELEGDSDGRTLVISWGSTYGAVKTAVDQCKNIAMLHLRHINPLPQGLEVLLKQYDKVFVAELNQGQLIKLIRAEYLIDAKGINQCSGLPFSVSGLVTQLNEECHERI